MKNLAALTLVLIFAVSSEAQIKKAYERVKRSVTGSAKLSQLHYFPSQWEVDLNLGYRFTSLSLNGKSTGLTVVKADQSISTAVGELTLGVLDNVYTQLKWQYLVNFNVDYSQPASLASTKASGPSDPELAAVVRLVNGESVKLDGKFEFSASTGDHQEPDANNDGDAKSGGNEITVGGRLIALITDSSQLGLTLDYTMSDVKTSIDQTNGQITESGKTNQTEIEISTLTEITSDLFFGLTLNIVNIDGYKSENLTTLSTSDYGSTSGKSFNIIGKYEFTPDSSVGLQAGYVVDYNTSVGTVDLSVTGYNLSANYLIRF